LTTEDTRTIKEVSTYGPPESQFMKFNTKQSLPRASSKDFIFSDLTCTGLRLRPLTAKPTKENDGDGNKDLSNAPGLRPS